MLELLRMEDGRMSIVSVIQHSLEFVKKEFQSPLQHHHHHQQEPQPHLCLHSTKRVLMKNLLCSDKPQLILIDNLESFSMISLFSATAFSTFFFKSSASSLLPLLDVLIVNVTNCPFSSHFTILATWYWKSLSVILDFISSLFCFIRPSSVSEIGKQILQSSWSMLILTKY